MPVVLFFMCSLDISEVGLVVLGLAPVCGWLVWATAVPLDEGRAGCGNDGLAHRESLLLALTSGGGSMRCKSLRSSPQIA